jgi:hypothetical protein
MHCYGRGHVAIDLIAIARKMAVPIGFPRW